MFLCITAPSPCHCCPGGGTGVRPPVLNPADVGAVLPNILEKLSPVPGVIAMASVSLLSLAAAARAKSGKAGGAALSVTKLPPTPGLAPALLEEADRFLDFVGLEKDVFRGKEFLRSLVRTAACWMLRPLSCCSGGCWIDSPEEVPGRDLEADELKKENALWVAEADLGIMLSRLGGWDYAQRAQKSKSTRKGGLRLGCVVDGVGHAGTSEAEASYRLKGRAIKGGPQLGEI